MRSPILIGLFHPLNLAMLAASAFAGLVAAWWLFPIGLLFWLIMVIWVARDPSLRFNYKMQSRSPLARRFQRYFDRIERSQLSVLNSLTSAPTSTRRALQPVRSEIDLLTAQVYDLCQRMTTLENYRLVSESRTDLEADLQKINTALNGIADPHVRREYQESQLALQDRIAKLDAVSTQLDRVEAQLMSLANEMDSVVAQVIRLQALGSKDAARQVPILLEQLRRHLAEPR
jgi:chromosome segregation ATPase